MFFDTILLNTQHGGRFGIAWLAATRGLKFVTKKRIKELDIIKLCEELELFIISCSASPKKRFSLRLSALLINGAIKIFREQVIMLQGEIYMITTRVRSVIIFDDGTGISETPPTPVAKVKTKRGKKITVVETPDLKGTPNLQEDIFLKLPNLDLDDILLPCARTDEISIREDLVPRQQQHEDDFGLSVLSRKEAEEELQSLLSRTQEAPISQPQYPSSDLVTPQVQIQVVAQVHAPKGSFIDEDKHLMSPLTKAKDPHIDNGQRRPHKQISKEPLEPIREIERPVDESSIVTSAIEIIAQPSEPVITQDIQPPKDTSQLVIQQREPAQEISTDKTIKHKRKSLVEIQLEEASKMSKVAQEKSKLFVNQSRKVFVRINRCNENEGQFINEKCPLPSPYKNISNEHLYDMFWFEDEESLIQVRARSSIRSVSASDSVGLRQRDAQRSTLEKESISDVGMRPSILSLETQAPESTPLAARIISEDMSLRQTTTEEIPEPTVPPTITFSTPRKRKRIAEDEGVQRPVIRRQPSVPKQSLVIEQPTIPRLSVTDVQSRVLEQITVIEEQPVPLVQILPEIEVEEQLAEEFVLRDQVVRERKGTASPTATDYRKRQQNIVDIVVQWASNEYITIEDICEKPLNRLNIARAFSDLITLAANRFLLLINEEDSLELKYIEKGPKLQNI